MKLRNMKVAEIISALQNLSPELLQESYDNAGLIVGDPKSEVSGALVCLDSTEDVVQEAIEKKCNLIIAHHPIIFGGLTSLTGKNHVERTVMLAIKHDIAIYAAHTNLDNVQEGVNRKIGNLLGVQNMQILDPKKNLLRKLVTFVPVAHAETIRSALFNAGAGHIGQYDQCSFNTSGEGSFRGGEETKPFVGVRGETHFEKEIRIETIFESFRQGSVIAALLNAHPYEEVAYDIYPLENEHPGIGAGMFGELPEAIDFRTFVAQVKKTFGSGAIKSTTPRSDKVKKVAWCGGAGSFLIKKAIASEADVYITGDIKYHEFFDADGQIAILDIGHYESEQFTMDLIAEKLKEKFPKFAVHLTKVKTNPVIYY
jgi:dinuclear metal center YbgI/SA1388 family protein